MGDGYGVELIIQSQVQKKSVQLQYSYREGRKNKKTDGQVLKVYYTIKIIINSELNAYGVLIDKVFDTF
jgi:hypothetical protein